MAADSNCFYCMKSERLQELMIEICPLSVSTLYLFKNQVYKGRCVVQLKEHKTEIFQLGEEERRLFFEDVAGSAEAVSRAFKPDKINYAVFGDRVPHFHMHVVPKYKDGPCWGKPFDFEPAEEKLLSGEGYKERIALIKKHLREVFG